MRMLQILFDGFQGSAEVSLVMGVSGEQERSFEW